MKMNIGLGWHFQSSPDITIIWHNGGTAGYRAFCGFVPEKKVGVVVLSNAGRQGVDDLGIQMLESHPGFQQDRTEISLDASILQRYVGRYFVRPGVVIVVELKGGNLIVFLRGTGKSAMHPESETDFFCKARDVQASFVVGKEGTVTDMVFHSRAGDYKARRIQ